MFIDLVKRNRSYRRFKEEIPVPLKDLYDFTEAARISPSPRNRQALKYILENRKDMNAEIFKQLAWAGALKDWKGPEDGKRPAAYIIILGDNSLKPELSNPHHDTAYGIAAQSITLAAAEKGYGCCMIAAIKRQALRKLYALKPEYQILLVIALGVPDEKIVLKEMKQEESYNYWRDESGTHYVPKRKLHDIIIKKPEKPANLT